jgi:hypothetical protein
MRDTAWSILLTLCLAVLVLLMAIIPGAVAGYKSIRPWFNLVLYSGITFSILLRLYWGLRNSARFWELYFTFCIIHLLIYAYYIIHVRVLSVLNYVVVCTIECVIVSLIFQWILGPPPE